MAAFCQAFCCLDPCVIVPAPTPSSRSPPPVRWSVTGQTSPELVFLQCGFIDNNIHRCQRHFLCRGDAGLFVLSFVWGGHGACSTLHLDCSPEGEKLGGGDEMNDFVILKSGWKTCSTHDYSDMILALKYYILWTVMWLY